MESWDLQVVGTGDELSLGRNTLQFIEAPMVHWPDSMFTYVKEAKTLLPNDAFGQHLASSKRFADEVDMDIVMDEASTYYANILMPFGSPIQKMIAKIGEMGLEIEAIGSSHGVIWRRPEDVQRIIDAYLRWSNFEAPERVCLFYDTMWHSTEKMTMAIADGVAQEGVECQVLKLSASARSEVAHQVLESQAFLVGTPTLNNQMFPTVGGFLTYIKGLRPKNRIAGAYGSYGWAGGAVKQVDAELRALGLDVIDPLEVKFMPNAEQLDACVELGRQVARKVKGSGVRHMAVTVLGLAGSARRGGNTETLLDWCLDAARDEGAEVVKFRLLRPRSARLPGLRRLPATRGLHPEGRHGDALSAPAERGFHRHGRAGLLPWACRRCPR